MRLFVTTISTMAVIFSLQTGIATAQDSTGSVPLGDLARQLKAQRAKADGKPKVFTNDNLPAPPSTGEPPASSTAKATSESKPGPQSAKQAGANESTTANAAETGEDTHGEKHFRAQMTTLQDRLEIHERELSVLVQKLNEKQMMYYPDPNKGLLQESGPTAMSDVNNLQDQIEKKKSQIAADQQALEDLREQLRRDGGDPGWLRLNSETPGQETVSPPGQSETSEAKNGTKEYWQAKFEAARTRLADAKERQRLAEDELNLLQIQETRQLDPNVKAELAEKITAKQDEIAKRRAAAEQAQKSLEDLQKRFKASGAPDDSIEPEPSIH